MPIRLFDDKTDTGSEFESIALDLVRRWWGAADLEVDGATSTTTAPVEILTPTSEYFAVSIVTTTGMSTRL